MTVQVRDSVVEAMADASGKFSVRPGMEAVVETLVQDIARDLVAVWHKNVQPNRMSVRSARVHVSTQNNMCI